MPWPWRWRWRWPALVAGRLGVRLRRLASLSVRGGYQPRISLQVLPEVPTLVTRSAVPALLCVPLALAGLERAVLWQVLVAAPALCALRAITYGVIRWARRRRGAGRDHPDRRDGPGGPGAGSADA